MNSHYASLLDSNRKLLETGKYSDLLVKCGATEWRAHRSIICERSKFFATACDGAFMESSSKTINLKDDDPAVVQLLLSYLYTLDYDDGGLMEHSTESRTETIVVDMDQRPADEVSDPVPGESMHDRRTPLMTNVLVYAMADKFDVPDLKILAKEKFSASAQGWPLPDFSAVVYEVLTSTPETDYGLRGIIQGILAQHVEKICPTPEAHPDNTTILNTRLEWSNALQEEGRFLYALLGTVAANNARENERTRRTQAQTLSDLLDVQEEMDSLKAELTQSKNQVRNTELQLTKLKARGTSLIHEINCRDECRHCKQAFQPAFEDIVGCEEWYDRGTLRCKKCRTKHNF